MTVSTVAQDETGDSTLGSAMKNISSVLSGGTKEASPQGSLTDMSHGQLVVLAGSMSVELEALYKASLEFMVEWDCRVQRIGDI